MKKRKLKKAMKRWMKEMRKRGFCVGTVKIKATRKPKTNPYIFDPKQEPAKFQPPVSLDAARRYCQQLLLERAMGEKK